MATIATEGQTGQHDRARRRAGMLLLSAGLVFWAVVAYLFGVLVPAGLDFDMLDDPTRMVPWLVDHAGLYSGMYHLYLAQQVLLAAAIVAADRAWRLAPDDGGFGRELATVAGLLSIGLAAMGIVGLVMAGHWAAAGFEAAGGPTGAELAELGRTYEVAADLGKGARLVSEPFFGWWLGWTGWAMWRRSGHRLWLALVAVGAWTAVVGLWKFSDPTVGFEDWLAVPISAALTGAGIGMLRSARLT
jgi:hypothetical protein